MVLTPITGTSRRVVDLAQDVAIVALAMAGAVTALGGSRWGLLWAGASLAGVGLQLARVWRVGRSRWTPLGRALVLRAAAASSTGVALGALGSSVTEAVLAALATAILVGCLAGEPFVARAERFRVPVASGLPGVPVVREQADLGPTAVVASLVATGLGLLVGAFGLSSVWWVVLAVVGVSPLLLVVLRGRAKIAAARHRRTLVPAAVAEYAPEFVVYTARPDDASYQVMMWLPYLQRAGLRFIVVVRNHTPATALADLTDVPVVEARGTGDLDALVVPSLKAAFYVNASSGNGVFVRFQHLRHVYLGHGDSDKPPSYNPTHAMYDEIFAAGPAATRRYEAHDVHIPQDKFRVVGRPQVEVVEPAAGPVGAVASPTVLYAPTWRGHVEETMLYSLPRGTEIVTSLLARGATVIFRPHPFSYDFPEDAEVIAALHQLLAADAASTGRAHRWGPAAETELGILDCINASDAMVSDVSSVVSDYLFSGKPFAMIAVPAEPDAFATEFPVSRASYIVSGDLSDLEPQLDAMMGADPLAGHRAEIRADYLGDFPAAHYADAFVAAVQRAASPIEDPDHHRAALEGSEEAPDGEKASKDAGGKDTGGKDTEDEGAPDEGAPDQGADDSDETKTRTSRNWGRYRRLLLRVGLDLAATAVALVALGSALAGGPVGLTVALVVAAVAAAFGSVWATVRRRSRRSRLLTEGEVTRTVLVFALAALAARAGVWSWPVVLALVLTLAAVAVERRIRSAWGRGGLTARNLPEALPPIAQSVPRGLLPLLNGLVLILGAVAVLVGVSLLLVVPAVLVAVLAADGTVRAVGRARLAQEGELRLREALEARAPEFAVYFASTVGAGYQLGMWLPYFLRIGRPFVIITRTVAMLRQIDALCRELEVEVPIVHRPTLRSVEDAVVPSMSAAFYVNNAVRNTHLIERRELTHVWLNHGDSEKPACFNPVHAIYDLIFSAGQAGIDRYARHGVSIPREKFMIVGRPQVERIVPAARPIREVEQPTVLYAPTWQGPYADSRVYSLPIGREIVTELLARGVRVVFRAHPFNYRYKPCRAMIAQIGGLLEADRAVTGRQHLWGAAAEKQLTIEDCFNLSDAMVCDVSAVVSDYLRSDKPFAMVAVGRTPDELVVEAPAAQAAYVLREDLSNLVAVCDDLLGPDPLTETRKATKIYYLGAIADDTYADGFLTAAREVIAAGAHR